MEQDGEEVVVNSLEDVHDLPNALIITNVPLDAFEDGQSKDELESLFREEGAANFEYFRSFKRVRITFQSPQAATLARIRCEQLKFHGNDLGCFFAQPLLEQTKDDNPDLLHPPDLEKQFLISPPASPPVGWEQIPESRPVINLELISRLAALGRERGAVPVTEEIHPGSKNYPSIILHTCPQQDNDLVRAKAPFCHTPCPPRQNP